MGILKQLNLKKISSSDDLFGTLFDLRQPETSFSNVSWAEMDLFRPKNGL